MPIIKKIALVDIDGCLLQNGQLNLALIEQLLRLQTKDYEIVLFTQRSAGVLWKNAESDLSRDPDARLENPLATITGILQALAKLGLANIKVSTSIDDFFGGPYTYYPHRLKTFESALQSAFEEAHQQGSLSLNPGHLLTADELNSGTLQTSIDADRARIIAWLEAETLEAEKIAYLKKMIESYINANYIGKIFVDAKQSALTQLALVTTKADCLALTHRIATVGLAQTGDLLATNAESFLADKNIYLPIDKNQQFLAVLQAALGNIDESDRVKVLLFDDNEANHRDIEAMLLMQSQPRALFNGFLVDRANIISLEAVPLGKDKGDLFRERTTANHNLITKVRKLLELDESVGIAVVQDAKNLVNSDNRLDQIAAAQCQIILDGLLKGRLSLYQDSKKRLEKSATVKCARASIKAINEEITEKQALLKLNKTAQAILQGSDKKELLNLPLFSSMTLIEKAAIMLHGDDGNKATEIANNITTIAREIKKLTLFRSYIEADIRQLTQLSHRYNSENRCITTIMAADDLQLLTVGCTGKEPEIYQRFPGQKRWDAREKVAKGLELAADAALDKATATLTILLGDQGYSLPVDVQEAVLIPYQKQENVFALLGNHELHCEGHGPKKGTTQQLAKDYVANLQKEQGGADCLPQVSMPAPYYYQIILNENTNVYQAFIIYIDSNLLPKDEVQQQWLQKVFATLDTLDPNKQVPRIVASHHSLHESVDKRGMNNSEGKKYDHPEAKSGNHHQLLAATFARLRINTKDLIWLAAHIHQTAIHVAGDLENALDLPLLQLMAGGGGSYSNTGDSKIIPQGLVFNENGFGFIQLTIPESTSKKNILVEYHNCDGLNPTEMNGRQQSSVNYELRVAYADKAVLIPQGMVLSKILLKKQQATVDFLGEVVTLDKPALLLWHLLTKHEKDLAYYQQAIAQRGISDGANCFKQLVTCLSLVDTVSEETLLKLRAVIQACLTAIIKPFYSDDDVQPHFLKKTELYKILLTNHSFLAQWQTLLAKGLSKDHVLTELHAIYVKPRNNKGTQEERFAEENEEKLDEDADMFSNPSDFAGPLSSVADGTQNSSFVRKDFNFDTESLWRESEVNRRDSLYLTKESLTNVGLNDAASLESVSIDESLEQEQVRPNISAGAINQTVPIDTFKSVAALRLQQNGQSYTLSPSAKRLLASNLNSALNDPELLVKALTEAAKQYTQHWWAYHQASFDGKPCPLTLLPLVAPKQDNVMLACFVESLLTSGHSPRYVLASLLHGLGDQHPAVDFRGMVLNVLTTFINVTLEKIDDASTRDLIKLLRNQSSDFYLGTDKEMALGRQHEAMKKILSEYFEKNTCMPLYQVCLQPEVIKTIWIDAYWQQQLLRLLVPNKEPALVQFLHVLWQQESSVSLRARTMRLFSSAPSKTLEQQLAAVVISATTVNDFNTQATDPKFASLQPLIGFIAAHFEVTKGELCAAGKEGGWLPSLRDVIQLAHDNAVIFSARPTEVVNPLAGQSCAIGSTGSLSGYDLEERGSEMVSIHADRSSAESNEF